MSGFHQLSVEGMFARADAQVIERLLDEAIGHFRIMSQPPREQAITLAEGP